MSQAVQLAKAAREKLASALNALQTEAEVPEGLMDVAEPIAQAMGVLHRVERSNGTDLEGRDKALEAVRRALDLLQKIDVSHPAVDACLEAVAASLSKVHGLTKVAAATPAPAAVAPAAPPPAAPPPAAIVPPATPFPPVNQLAHQQIPRPVAASYPAPAAAPPAVQPAPQPAPAPAPVAAWPPAVAITPAAPAPAPAAPAPAPAAPPAGSQGPGGTQVMGGASGGGADARMQGGTLMMQKSPVDAALAAQAIGVPPAASAPTAPAPVAAQAYAPAPVAAPVGFPPVAPAPMVAATSPFPAAAPSPAHQAAPQAFAAPVAAPVQAFQPQPVAAFGGAPDAPVPAAAPAPARSPGPAPAGSVVVELGAHSASNFYKGLSGNDVIEAGGIFVGTYKVPKLGTQVSLRVLLPGDYEFHATGVVQWVRESGDGVEPGFGAKFTQITPEGRQLVYRYARNREPLFYDDL